MAFKNVPYFQGFIMHAGAYLRDPWNWLDFIIVILAYVNFLPGMSNFTSLRALRLLRPLRTIRTLEVRMRERKERKERLGEERKRERKKNEKKMEWSQTFSDSDFVRFVFSSFLFSTSYFQGMRVIVSAMLDSLPDIGQAFLILSFVFIIFGGRRERRWEEEKSSAFCLRLR
jgi:ABC-type multidrug transport system fused ATPase/permease subunit